MLSGSPLGHIAQWDLEERKLQSEIRSAHEGAITGMQCLPSQPLLITSSPDNSIKVCFLVFTVSECYKTVYMCLCILGMCSSVLHYETSSDIHGLTGDWKLVRMLTIGNNLNKF